MFMAITIYISSLEIMYVHGNNYIHIFIGNHVCSWITVYLKSCMFMDNYIPIFIGNPVCSWITIYLSSLEILYVHG